MRWAVGGGGGGVFCAAGRLGADCPPCLSPGRPFTCTGS